MPQNRKPKVDMEKFLVRCFVIILLIMIAALPFPEWTGIVWFVGVICFAIVWLISLFWLVFFRFKFSLAQMLVAVLMYATAMTVTKAVCKDIPHEATFNFALLIGHYRIETALLIAFAFGHSLALGLGMVIGLNNIAVMGEVSNLQRWFLFFCGLLFLYEIAFGIAAILFLLSSDRKSPFLICATLLVAALSAVCFITTNLCLRKKRVD